jgi:hypothetical protein
MANPAVHEMPTQMISGDGPMAALIKVSVFAGNTHPRYPEICAKHVAFHVLMVWKPALRVVNLQ